MMQHLDSSECIESILSKIESFNNKKESNKLSKQFNVDIEDDKELVLEIESKESLNEEDMRSLRKNFEGFLVSSGSKLKYDSSGNSRSLNIVNLRAKLD